MPWFLLVASLVCTGAPGDPGLTVRRQRLTEDAAQGARWSWGWGSAVAVSAVGHFSLAIVIDDAGFRIDRLVAGSTSLVGVLAVGVTHPRAARVLRALGPCPSDAAVNAALERVSAEEHFAIAWYQHALGVAFNSGAGLYLGLVHDRWRSGAIQAVVGTGISEAMILTRPRRVADFELSPLVSSASQTAGLTLSIRF